jgi:LysM repeat protein
VERFAQQYRAACGEQLVVTSAMRPRSFRLPNSVDRSVHPTGMAIDFRRPSDHRCLSWMRQTLLSLEGAGVLEVVEERRPPHFHVAVFPRPYRQYVELRLGRDEVLAALPDPPAGAAASESAAYQVRRGDTLWGIAQRHGMSVEELMAANELRDNRIVAGQRLTIPARR